MDLSLENQENSGQCDNFVMDMLGNNPQLCKNCQQHKKTHTFSKKQDSSVKNAIKDKQDQLKNQLNSTSKNEQTQKELEELRLMKQGFLKDILSKFANMQFASPDLLKYASESELEMLKNHMNGTVIMKQEEIKELLEKWLKIQQKERGQIGKLDANLHNKFNRYGSIKCIERKNTLHNNRRSSQNINSLGKPVTSINEICEEDYLFIINELKEFEEIINLRIDDLQTDTIMNHDFQSQFQITLNQLLEMQVLDVKTQLLN